MTYNIYNLHPTITLLSATAYFATHRSKKEDPCDIAGIEKPKIDIVKYENLKAYLLEEVKAFK